MATPRLNSGSSVAAVQAAMNEAIKIDKYWSKRKNWQNLVIARNNFIRQELEALGLTIAAYNRSEKYEKNEVNEKLHTRFRNEFFAYSRTADWMITAVSNNAIWIQIEGIETYMVRSALMAITNKPEKDTEQGTGGQVQGPEPDEVQGPEPDDTSRPFDPIRSI